jgi:hypothetical protein
MTNQCTRTTVVVENLKADLFNTSAVAHQGGSLSTT